MKKPAVITSCSRCLLPCDTTYRVRAGYPLAEVSQCCVAPVVRTTEDTNGQH